MFFISSEFKDRGISLLFSSKVLLGSFIKQSNIQPSFIHLDATFKLIDLGLPLMDISTETINHNFSPIAFFVTWSESIKNVKYMFKQLMDFYSEKMNTQFRPLYIMTDNCDALISGCKQSFSHEYTHLSCHFHIGKRMREKAQGIKLKNVKFHIFFGLKLLKNACSLPFFQKTWDIFFLF